MAGLFRGCPIRAHCEQRPCPSCATCTWPATLGHRVLSAEEKWRRDGQQQRAPSRGEGLAGATNAVSHWHKPRWKDDTTFPRVQTKKKRRSFCHLLTGAAPEKARESSNPAPAQTHGPTGCYGNTFLEFGLPRPSRVRKDFLTEVPLLQTLP